MLKGGFLVAFIAEFHSPSRNRRQLYNGAEATRFPAFAHQDAANSIRRVNHSLLTDNEIYNLASPLCETEGHKHLKAKVRVIFQSTTLAVRRSKNR
jgi:hypothetical protein